MHLLVGDRDDRADGPVGQVVRQQPREALPPDLEERPSLLRRDREGEQARVDEVVGGPGSHAEGDRLDHRHAPGPEAQDERGRETRGGQHAEVVDRRVDRRPADHGVRQHRGEREHDRCAAPDQGRSGERADGPHRDGARLGLEGERLAARHERGEREERDDVGRLLRERHGQPQRRQHDAGERRPLRHVADGGGRIVGGLRRERRRGRDGQGRRVHRGRGAGVQRLLRRSRHPPLGVRQQVGERLRATVHDAVASLDLRPEDGEVGAVNQRVEQYVYVGA